MKATEALRKMVRESGKSAIAISREIGRGPNYVSSLLSSGSVPSVETFASIARACDCELRLTTPTWDAGLDGWEPGEKGASRA